MLPESLWGSCSQRRLGGRLLILRTSLFSSVLACPSPSLHMGTARAGYRESELLERTISCNEIRGSCHRQVLPDFHPECNWSADWYHRQIKLLKWKLWQNPISVNLLCWVTPYTNLKISGVLQVSVSWISLYPFLAYLGYKNANFHIPMHHVEKMRRCSSQMKHWNRILPFKKSLQSRF